MVNKSSLFEPLKFYCMCQTDAFIEFLFVKAQSRCVILVVFCISHLLQLKGEVDDCSCKVESLDSLNNNKIYPRLQSLITKDYFRFFKVSTSTCTHIQEVNFNLLEAEQSDQG